MSDLKNKSLFLPKSTLSKAPVGRQTARSSRLSCARVGSGGRGAGPCGEQPAPCCRARRGAERILWNSSIGSVSQPPASWGDEALGLRPSSSEPVEVWHWRLGGRSGKAAQDKLGCARVHPDGAQRTRQRRVHCRPAPCPWLWSECAALGVEGVPETPGLPVGILRGQLSSQ